MKADDSEMMTAQSLAEKTVLKMVHHLETQREQGLVMMKAVKMVQMMADYLVLRTA